MKIAIKLLIVIEMKGDLSFLILWDFYECELIHPLNRISMES